MVPDLQLSRASHERGEIHLPRDDLRDSTGAHKTGRQANVGSYHDIHCSGPPPQFPIFLWGEGGDKGTCRNKRSCEANGSALKLTGCRHILPKINTEPPSRLLAQQLVG